MNGRDLFFSLIMTTGTLLKKLLGITDAKIERQNDYLIAAINSGTNESNRLHKFFQHAGCGLSSRQAERILEALGQVDQCESIIPNPNAEKEIKVVISKAHGPEIDEEDVILASSGANAFTSVFRSALEISREKRKSIWIRIGWLYLDTIEVMDLLTESVEQIIDLHTPEDFEKLRKYLQPMAAKLQEW